MLSISLFGLFISLMFAAYAPTFDEGFNWRKPLVGLIFGLICVSGMFAALIPKECSKVFHFKGREENLASNTVPIAMAGHHPDCVEFSSHVIHTRNHTLCAACTGLFLGAFINLLGTIFYFFCGGYIGFPSFAVVFLGAVGIILGFLQLKFSGFYRLLLNVLFALGAFLILAGVDGLTQSLFVDLFLISLIVFWIWTRITLSKWDHWKTCYKCKFKCARVFSKEK